MNRELEKQKTKLLNMKQFCVQQCKKLPKGNIRSSNQKGKTYFFIYDSNNKSIPKEGKYVRQKEISSIVPMIQHEYYAKMLPVIEEQLGILDAFANNYDPSKLSQVYATMSEGKRNMVTPLVISDEEYIKQWLARPYPSNNSYPIDSGLYTSNGEHVRSKSELVIADRLKELGIPYKYEYPLKLNTGEIVYPDFTLLDVKRRREIYLEHLGKMSDSEYISHNLLKIERYERNGLFPGDRLILLHETSDRPLDIKTAMKIIKNAVGLS